MKKGEFVQFDGLPAVIVGTESDKNIPANHVALWFGNINLKRKSQGGLGNVKPDVWIVPEDLCEESPCPEFKH